MMRNIWSYGPEQRKAAFRSGQFAMDTESAQSVGLVGWWPLGVHGGDADDLDYSGFKNHGTRTNGPTRQVVRHPKWGGAHVLNFDGTEDYVNSGPVITGTLSNVSMSFWAFRSATNKRLMTGWGDTDDQRFNVVIWTDGKIYWQLENGSGNTPSTSFTGIGWHHYHLVYDGALAQADQMRGYVDGNDQGVSSGVDIAAKTFSGDFTIGSEQLNSRYSAGLHDDIRVWSRSLGPSEVNSQYQEPWRLVRPLGTRTISFAPPAAAAADPFTDSFFVEQAPQRAATI